MRIKTQDLRHFTDFIDHLKATFMRKDVGAIKAATRVTLLKDKNRKTSMHIFAVF